MSSLYFTGMAPSATAALSKAQNAFITSGARLFILFILVRFSFLNIGFFLERASPMQLAPICGSRNGERLTGQSRAQTRFVGHGECGWSGRIVGQQDFPQ